jgi:hypothetical protein
MSKYIIIDAESIQKRIEELEKEEVSEFSPGRRTWVNSAIKNLKEVLSQSTPLIPEIEKAFDAGSERGEYGEGNANNKQDYISNLKLDI